MQLPQPTTHNSDPLWPGQASQFMWITFSLALLLIVRSGRWVPELSLGAGLLLATLGYTLLQAPFDIWAGVLKRTQGLWLWLRGVTAQAALFVLMGVSIGKTAQLTGAMWGAWLAFLVGMLLLSGLQVWIAVVVGHFKIESGSFKGIPVVWLQTKLKAFSGGISGLPGQETLVLPKGWENQLPENVYKVVLIRRAAAIKLRSHGWGVLIALGWNLACFMLATWLAVSELGGFAWVLEVVLANALINLAGLLTFLPFLSKRASFAADHWAYFNGMDADDIRKSFQMTGAWIETAPKRQFPAWYWWASVPERETALKQQIKTWGAFQVAALSLYFGWAALNPMSRAWPGITGKPELWVFGPGD